MNAPAQTNSSLVPCRTHGTMIVAALVAVGLLCVDPGDFSLAYRFVVFAVLAPAMGCLIFTLIHRLTGGQWAVGLRPFLIAGVNFVPWIWLLVLPLPLLPSRLGRFAPPLTGDGFGYESRSMFLMRSGIYAVIFFGLRRALAQDAGRDDAPTKNRRPWVGPVGLLVLVFTLTFLADDWLESLEPGWHSTAFALVWMTGQAVAGLSLALLGGLAYGAQPAVTGSAGRSLGLDWGNLLLASLFCWCYVAFAQYLIIWAGNLPAEISWYQHRSVGLWSWIPPLLIVFGFFLPFLLLLSRRLKVRAGGLRAVALLVVLSQLGYTAWLILPTARPLSLTGGFLVGALLILGGAVFVDRYAAACRPGRTVP